MNSGSAEELQALPGIGETLSQLIISERENNGNFYYPEDLTAVKGIGIKKLEQFRELLDLSQGGD
ncbi:helix-hairpin-helix domain-containing protein [Clostridiales bacterium]|nr:helix-hairpin-helix domain-containing protein [Clostridiales bacterium]